MKYIANVLVKVEVEANSEEYAKELLQEKSHRLFMNINGCQVNKGCFSLKTIDQEVKSIGFKK